MIRVKILWLSHRDIRHPRAGGAELTIYEVGKRLVADGHKVNWITPRPIASPKKELIDGIIISRIGGNLIVHVASIIYILTMRQDYDIIIDDMGHAMPWFSRLITRKPVIVYFRHRHSRTLKGQVNRILASFLTLMERGYRIFYRGCAFVTESESSLQDLISMGIPETKIFLNPVLAP